MGSCCGTGNKNKQIISPSKLKGGRKNKNYKRKRERRDSTTTSYFDIRKVYRFTNKILGHGNFGTVRLASDMQNEEMVVAVKTI